MSECCGCNCGGEAKKPITADMTIGEVLRANPKAAEVLFSHGMHCLGCPSAQGESIGEAAAGEAIDLAKLLADLNKE